MRFLKENEIMIKKALDIPSFNGYQVLLYKTARVDMEILDEEFGSMNWKDEYFTLEGKMSLYCKISVWDREKHEWISKISNSDESNSREKEQASDALKRCGFLWGIGRELYSAPFIIISKSVNPNTLKIEKITYENRKIKDLVIKDNSSGKIVWSNIPYNEKSYPTPQAKKSVSTSEPVPVPAPAPAQAIITNVPRYAQRKTRSNDDWNTIMPML